MSDDDAMRPTQGAATDATGGGAFGVTPDAAVAQFELDRFCGGCGYNLRTQPITRDPHTRILVVRCTECGRFQPATDATTAVGPWLSRLTILMIVVWMLLILFCAVWLGIAQGAMSYATVEEFTTWEQVEVVEGDDATASGRTFTEMIVNTSAPGGPVITRRVLQRAVRSAGEWDTLFLSFVLVSSALIAFTAGTMGLVTLPHWPRQVQAVIALLLPVVAGGVAAWVLFVDSPQLLDWGVRHIASHVVAQLVGGLIAVMYGRPLARLIVRIMLPPSVRPRLAYLWLADGKKAPR